MYKNIYKIYTYKIWTENDMISLIMNCILSTCADNGDQMKKQKMIWSVWYKLYTINMRW